MVSETHTHTRRIQEITTERQRFGRTKSLLGSTYLAAPLLKPWENQYVGMATQHWSMVIG